MLQPFYITPRNGAGQSMNCRTRYYKHGAHSDFLIQLKLRSPIIQLYSCSIQSLTNSGSISPAVLCFAAPNAQLRKPKKVREIIEVQQNALKPLINDFGLEKVIDIVIILLNGRIFHSEMKAKIAF